MSSRQMLLQQSGRSAIVEWGRRYGIGLDEIGEEIIVRVHQQRAARRSGFTSILFHYHNRQLRILIGSLSQEPCLRAHWTPSLTSSSFSNDPIGGSIEQGRIS